MISDGNCYFRLRYIIDDNNKSFIICEIFSLILNFINNKNINYIETGMLHNVYVRGTFFFHVEQIILVYY